MVAITIRITLYELMVVVDCKGKLRRAATPAQVASCGKLKLAVAAWHWQELVANGIGLTGHPQAGLGFAEEMKQAGACHAGIIRHLGLHTDGEQSVTTSVECEQAVAMTLPGSPSRVNAVSVGRSKHSRLPLRSDMLRYLLLGIYTYVHKCLRETSACLNFWEPLSAKARAPEWSVTPGHIQRTPNAHTFCFLYSPVSASCC